MRKFDPALLDKPRWLVFTKADLLPADEARQRAEQAVSDLGWQAPWLLISAVTQSGTQQLVQRISAELERIGKDERPLEAHAGGEED
jgi:GTP-binding protein